MRQDEPGRLVIFMAPGSGGSATGHGHVCRSAPRSHPLRQPTRRHQQSSTVTDDAGLTRFGGGGDLVELARQEDARHWAVYQGPISAETLRKRLRIGAARSRMLVSVIRADRVGQRTRELDAATG